MYVRICTMTIVLLACICIMMLQQLVSVCEDEHITKPHIKAASKSDVSDNWSCNAMHNWFV